MKKGIVFVTVFALLLLILVGCGTTTTTTATTAATTSAGKAYKIAWIGTSNTDESIKWMAKNAQDKAKELGMEITIFDPNGDVQKQTNMINDAIAAKYDALLFIPIDRQALIAAAKKATEAGLVVVTFGGDLAPEGFAYRQFFSGPNDLEAGQLAAAQIVKQFPNGAKGVQIMGGPGEDPQVKRETGFAEGIKGTKIELLGSQACEGWNPDNALKNMEDFITKYGDDIKWVYSHWDNGSTSIVKALEAAGMKDVYIVSVDGCREGFRLVNEGLIAATIYQDMKDQQYTAVQGAYDILKGGKPAASEIFSPWKAITKENANFDPGW